MRKLKISTLLSALLGFFAGQCYGVDLNDAEVKAAIAAAVAAEVQGLKDKNAELIADLKKARKGAEIKPEDLEKLEQEVDRLKGELTTAQKAAKDATKAAETATQQLQAESSFTQKLLVDNGLNAALLEAGVKNPVHLKAAAALLKTGNKIDIKVDGDTRSAIVGDKALSDFVKAWAAGEEGKAFVSAPDNSGSGARGGQAGGGAKSITRAEFEKLGAVDRSEHFKAGGTITD